MLRVLAFIGIPTVGIPVGVIAAAGDELPPWMFVVIAIISAILTFVGVATQKVVPGWLYTKQEKELLEVKADNKRLVELVLQTQATTGPALASATKAIEEMLVETRVIRRGGQ